eukprot:scaffold12537_cov72-Phaeocystis_antarctica.AAC.7
MPPGRRERDAASERAVPCVTAQSSSLVPPHRPVCIRSAKCCHKEGWASLSCVAPALSAQLGAARLQREEVLGRGRRHDLEHEAYCQGGDHLLELSHGERLPDAVALAN